MTLRYAYVSHQLPESKMRLHPTRIINIIGGPGCGKSLFTAAIVLYLTLHHKKVELIPDFAKALVWQKDYEALKNQYRIAQQQYNMMALMDGQVQYLINECSLPQLMFYNEHYADNICNVDKTREHMLAWYKQFNNVNILIDRADQPHVHTGRFQSEEQAREVDRGLRAVLAQHGMSFTVLKPVVTEIHAFTAALLKDEGTSAPAAPAQKAG